MPYITVLLVAIAALRPPLLIELHNKLLLQVVPSGGRASFSHREKVARRAG
jgi:hypothetical protein